MLLFSPEICRTRVRSAFRVDGNQSRFQTMALLMCRIQDIQLFSLISPRMNE